MVLNPCPFSIVFASNMMKSRVTNPTIPRRCNPYTYSPVPTIYSAVFLCETVCVCVTVYVCVSPPLIVCVLVLRAIL